MAKDLVLITGAASHVGFEQIDKLKHTATLQKHLEDVEFVLISDLQEPSGLKEAIKGVSGVIHVATPIPLKLDRDHFYDSAKRGTLNLFTVAANEPSVKQIVVTSTCGITEYARPGPTGNAETAKKAGSAYLAYQ
ncbi:hypothetical protein GGP41_001485 [Bipolaris sorokiniana]|uniref:3-beta hydroxysteroid dehydrogenase/isomerase domain-containing protein n=1 Tax=Cochliobolus sativus TaxID=45130 RepID=A0A8H6DYQ8_COCSA|nr:hypothetical protein GGP41_001485 [Bipolaris sorokiniana]